MPLHFSDEEMTLLLELSRPIEPAQRSAFLDAWPPRSGSRRAGRASFTRPRGGSRGLSPLALDIRASAPARRTIGRMKSHEEQLTWAKQRALIGVGMGRSPTLWQACAPTSTRIP